KLKIPGAPTDVKAAVDMNIVFVPEANAGFYAAQIHPVVPDVAVNGMGYVDIVRDPRIGPDTVLEPFVVGSGSWVNLLPEHNAPIFAVRTQVILKQHGGPQPVIIQIVIRGITIRCATHFQPFRANVTEDGMSPGRARPVNRAIREINGAAIFLVCAGFPQSMFG